MAQLSEYSAIKKGTQDLSATTRPQPAQDCSNAHPPSVTQPPQPLNYTLFLPPHWIVSLEFNMIRVRESRNKYSYVASKVKPKFFSKTLEAPTLFLAKAFLTKKPLETEAEHRALGSLGALSCS